MQARIRIKVLSLLINLILRTSQTKLKYKAIFLGCQFFAIPEENSIPALQAGL